MERERLFHQFNHFLQQSVPQPVLGEVAELYFPEKLKIKVLEEILQASNAFERLATVSFGKKRTDKYEFEYKGYIWTSTIKAQWSQYQSENVPYDSYFFVNLKIPNDGYIFRTELEKDGILAKTDETYLMILPLLKKIQDLKLFKGLQPSFRFEYSADRGRMELYFLDVPNKCILTIKADYGHPCASHTNLKTLEEWAGLEW